MQDLEPNMEDLFRSAAESLPLKDEDNWQQVAEKISAQTVVANSAQAQRKKRRKYLFLVLMVLFLLTASWWLIYFTGNEISSPGKSNYKDSADNQKSKIESLHKIKEVITEVAVDRETNDPALIRRTNVDGFLKEPLARRISRNSDKIVSREESSKVSYVSPDFNDLINVTKEPGMPSGKPEPPDDFCLIKNYFTNEIDHDFRETFSIEFKKKDSLVFTPIVRELFQNTFQNPIFGRRFYYGAIAGPGFNSVQSHDINKTGFEAGILSGYKLSRKLFVETGIYFSKNFYEAKAVSFSQKGIEAMLAGGRELNEVHGNNFLLKLPINLGYNFTTGSNKLFVSAGVSSFMVTKESNWYLTTINGSSEMLYGEYRNKRFYFAGAVNISAGYEKKIRGKYSLRIQPYVQLPTQGVGIGNLRFMSTGLHLGLLRPGN